MNNVKMPKCLDSEQLVLRKIINNHTFLSEVEDILTITDFYWSKHQEIYRNILELSAKSSEIDLVMLLEYITAQNKVKECGGVSYITEIACNVLAMSNIYNHLNIIKEKSNRRKLIKAGQQIIINSCDGTDVNKIIDLTEDNICKLLNSKASGNVDEIDTAINNLLTKIEENYNNGGGILGISTGFDEVDNTISGLQKGDFIIVAARPSMGKTAFALNIGLLASAVSNVALFSLEMTTNQLMERLISSKCLINFSNIRTGQLNDDQFNKIAKASISLSKNNLFIDDRSTSLEEIKAKCRYYKIKKGLDVVIVDYLQLIEVNERLYSREQEVAKVSRELKKLAKKLDITIIALSQLSRASEARVDKRPLLSDLRESGAIEQDADVILLLYRDEYYNKESDNKNIAEIIVSKNRNGEVKTIKLGWFGEYQRFTSLEVR